MSVRPGFQSLMHRLQAVPCPRLRALAERVVEDHGQVHLLGFILRHSGFERLLVIGDDGETLGWNPVALWSISITSKGNAHACLRCARPKLCRELCS